VALILLLAHSVRHAWKFGFSAREVLRQIVAMGTQSMLLIVCGMAFFGAVLIEHGASQARQIVGDISIVGSAWFEVVLRDLAPTIAGVLAAVRIGAALSAEIAAMKVTEQLDALELSAGDVSADIVFPRLLAGLVAIPALLIVGTASAELSSAASALFFYGADSGAFLNPELIGGDDLFAFVIKALGYGLAIPLAAIQCGLSADGGPGGVGEATTRGVVAASMMVLLLNVILSLALFFSGL
jgi:phospholipid/cholesterol/gamma-HCH transport system permease protein